MTVLNETSYSPLYAGNGVTVDFNTTFVFNLITEIAVVTVVDDTGVETIVDPADYSLFSGGSGATGTIRMDTAPATGVSLRIVRDIPLTQETDYVEGTKFPAATHELALDKLTEIAQQTKGDFDRAIKLPVTSVNYPVEFPDGGASRAGYMIRWDSVDGSTLEAVDVNTAFLGTSATSTYMLVGNGATFDLKSPSQVRSNLGLVIGTDVQAYDAQLDTLSGLTVSGATNLVNFSTTYPNHITIDGDANAYLKLDNGLGNVTIKATNAGTWTFRYPSSGGTSGYLLSTDGSGNTSWVAPTSAQFASNLSKDLHSSSSYYDAGNGILSVSLASTGLTSLKLSNRGVLKGIRCSLGVTVGSEIGIVFTHAGSVIHHGFSYTTSGSNFAQGFLLPGRNIISVQAGDSAKFVLIRYNTGTPDELDQEFVSDGSETYWWKCVAYTRADGTALVQTVPQEAYGVFTQRAKNLSDLTSAATARTNLGLAIGTNVQAYDAELAAIAGLTSAADKGIQFTGSGTAATYDLTAAGKSLLDDADASAQRTTLGLGTLATQSGTFSGTSSGTNTGDQLVFKTIAVSGQSDVVADTATDTLTLAAGSNITITTDATTDTITIAASGGAGLVDADYGDITVSGSGTVMTIDNDVVTYAKMQNVSATDKLLGRSTAGSGDVEEIACTAAGRAILDDADAAAQRTTLGLGTLATQSGTFSGTSSGTNTGDQLVFKTISVSGQSDVVADTETDTLTLAAGANIVITTNSGTDTITIAASGSGTLGDGDYGDITASSSGTVLTIDNDVVTYAKMQNVSATDKILGRSTAGAGDVEEITCTATGRSILDDTSVGAVRTTIGVGTGDSPEFAAVNIGAATDTTITRTGAGDIAVEGNAIYRAGGTDVPVTDGGTGASDASTARTNLGLAIGTNVQAYDAELAAIAGLTSAADSAPYFTGSGTAALMTVTSAARTILDDTTVGAIATTLGLGTGDSPQFTAVNIGHASDTTITRSGAGDIAVEGNAIYRAGGTDVPVTDGGTGASDAATARTNLGLAIGTNVQAYDATLTSLAALNSTGMLAQTGVDTFAYRTITGTSFQITTTTGDGVSGNPTLSLPSTLVAPGTVTSTTVLTAGQQLCLSGANEVQSASYTGDTLQIHDLSANFITINSPNALSSLGTKQKTTPNVNLNNTPYWITFSSSLILRHSPAYRATPNFNENASIFCLGGKDIVTQPGDTALMVYNLITTDPRGTGWYMLAYYRADGTALTGSLPKEAYGLFPQRSKNLSDLASASTARTNLGLGSLATQSGTFSGTSSGTNTGDQLVFNTIAVSGQSDVVADTATDTLTLVAGANITITTNATTDTITIASTGGATLGDGDYGDIVVSGSGTVMTIDSGVIPAGGPSLGLSSLIAQRQFSL